jgi:hypothetical protein
VIDLVLARRAITGTAGSVRAPRAAMPSRRREAWLRIFVVRCSLPCDPPAGGHSRNGAMIPRFHRAVCDLYGAIDVKAGVSSILFDLTATISSSRPNFPWPLRAAAVKGGRRPSRNDLPLMVASTAADLLDWGGRFQ